MAIKRRTYTVTAGQRLRLDITQGEDLELTLICIEPPDAPNAGSPVDFTGSAQQVLTVRDRLNSLVFPARLGTVDVDPLLGKVVFLLGASDTAAAAAQYCEWDWRWVDGSGNTAVLVTQSTFAIGEAVGVDGDDLSTNPPLVVAYGLRWRDDVASGVWDSATEYFVNDAIRYTVGGVTSSYRCIQRGTNHLPTDTAYWEPIAIGSSPGLRWRDDVNAGIYDDATAYQVGDGVGFAIDGVTSSYRCILDTAGGHDPTDATYWRLLASGASGGGSSLPDFDSSDANKFLGVDSGGNLVWAAVQQSQIVPTFDVTGLAVSPSLSETGTTITPSFTLSANRAIASSPAPSVTDGTHTDNLTPSGSSATGNAGRTYSRSTPGSQSFTGSATGAAGGSDSASGAASWADRVWFGMFAPQATNGDLNESDAQGLASTRLASTRAGAYAFSAGDGSTIPTIILPASLGDIASMTVRPLNLSVFDSLEKVQTGLLVTNQAGVVETCNVFQLIGAFSTDAFTYDVG